MTTNRTPPAELTEVLHNAGTDWDDLRYKVEEALIDHWHELHGRRKGSDGEGHPTAVAWANRIADKYLAALNPTKDV